MKEEKPKIPILLIVTILSFIGGCISYFYLEHEIPLQWDINWKVSNSAPKEAVFLLSAVPLILYVIMSTGILNRRGGDRRDKGSRITTIATTCLLIVLQWVSIAAALEVTIDIELIFPIIAGIIFIVIGNFMPTVKRNYWIGFRTPWSVRNDICWKKTNRFGGYFMSVLGILMIIDGVVQQKLLNIITAIIMAIGVIYGFIYSYRLRNAE